MSNPYSHFSELSDDDSNETERGKILERIALSYLLRGITDNNPSEKNNLSTLEQILHYEFFHDIYDEYDLEGLKQEIIAMAQTLEGEYGEEECITRDYVYSQRNRINKRIARAIFLELITDDNPSDWTGLSSLEEIICYEYGEINPDELVRAKKEIFSLTIGLRGGSNMGDFDDPEDAFEQEGF